jgi:L-ascorbate metabolism protein UlaG (beta-lactamase superfamily)
LTFDRSIPDPSTLDFFDFMKRRHFLHGVQLSTIAAVAAIATGSRTPARSQTTNLSITYLGHTCFRFSGGGLTVMANPFRPGGCTAGYPAPDARNADITVVSSLLLDEGATDNVSEDRLLFESGIYQFGTTQFEGIPIAHDRFDGKRFGTNLIWVWEQAGIKIAHLGGGAAPLQFEQRVLIGRPDVLLLPIGGGDKAYTPEEALVVMRALNPRLVIPTHYQTTAADEASCEIEPLSTFLELEALQTLEDQGDIVLRSASGTLTVTASALPAADDPTAIYLLTPQGLPNASNLRITA